MKEKTSLIAVFLIVSMIAMAVIPAAKAWEYYDTTIANPKTDNYVDYYGPRADKIQINMYQNELAEFTALELGQIDMTDWPVDSAHYLPWITPGMNGPGYADRIAVIDSGADFGLYIIDLRLDNRTVLDDGSPNPAYNAQNGNPMANLALRRAIASICDHKYAVETIMSGGALPLLGNPLYTPLSNAYGGWRHPEIIPTGALAQWCYVTATGQANVAGGNTWLNNAGYVYDAVADARKDPTGYKFTIELYYRVDHTYRRRMALEVLQPLIEAAPPNGLGMKGNLVMMPVVSSAARVQVMDLKKGHLYTGGWGLTIDPDHLYYLFGTPGYWHPGRPTNYMYYPGDGDKYTVTSDGWHYTGFNARYLWSGSGLDFSDPDKTYDTGAEIWQNPGNYWAWEMMIATTDARALYACYKSQEWLAWYASGVPMWATQSYTAFHRTYTGAEAPYTGQPWKGVVNQAGFGPWSTMSFYNMHTANAPVGNGAMTIRQGFRQPTMSLNPLYAEWVWDWYVLNNAYDGMITAHPYTLSNNQNLATSWELGTWDSPDYGTCSKITFHMRHDLKWSDGTPLTSSDVKFTWGGPLMTGSISNLLAKKGYPPAYWSTNLLDMLSIATPDQWTVVCYLDVFGYFAIHSMSGFNLVLPEHIWKPIINTGDPTQPWDQPAVSSSGFTIDHTWDPMLHGNVITLSKNPNHNMQVNNKPFPIVVWTDQPPNGAREDYGNTHYIYPKSGDTAVNLHVHVSLHSYYRHETGALKTQLFPLTKLDGTKVVSIWKWTGTGSIADPANYVLVETKPTANFDILFCVPEEEGFNFNGLTPGWYQVRVVVTITSCTYFDGVWIDATAQSPWTGDVKTYTEYSLITSRYDIGGNFFKRISSVNYGPISDIKVEIKDLYATGLAYGTSPGYANWNTACDVNNDNTVDVKDYYKISQNYGWP